MLGYDLLFQDVDIIWYKHPLDYFKTDTGFDIYFQERWRAFHKIRTLFGQFRLLLCPPQRSHAILLGIRLNCGRFSH